jgi:hypothetical protein
MKIMETIQIPASTREHLKETKCDICGKVFRGSDWDAEVYEISETEVRYKEGNSYPDSGSGTETKIDVCPDCFKTKLIPWVKSFGISDPKAEEWDW